MTIQTRMMEDRIARSVKQIDHLADTAENEGWIVERDRDGDPYEFVAVMEATNGVAKVHAEIGREGLVTVTKTITDGPTTNVMIAKQWLRCRGAM